MVKHHGNSACIRHDRGYTRTSNKAGMWNESYRKVEEGHRGVKGGLMRENGAKVTWWTDMIVGEDGSAH